MYLSIAQSCLLFVYCALVSVYVCDYHVHQNCMWDWCWPDQPSAVLFILGLGKDLSWHISRWRECERIGFLINVPPFG